MIKEIKIYTLLCDNCGADVNENNEYSGYENIEDSRDYASENDWLKHEGKIYCPKCYFYDAEDFLILKDSKNKSERG